ncbi:MAG: hypothetical protein HOP11_06465 [Saprospiraceae bacterium]|nr:hypothetical protein [Saprospiraceae bacterium]
MRIIVLTILIGLNFIHAQSTGYGIRGGLGLSSQRWASGSDRDPLLTYHGDFTIDIESEKGNVFYIATGYHQRGSAIIFSRFVDQNGNTQPGGSFGMKFHNVGLEIGVKKARKLESWKVLYGVGARVEYNAKTQIDVFPEYTDFIVRTTAGLSLHGSVERNLNKFVVFGLEGRVSPDFTRQIYVPPGTPYFDPTTGGVRNGPEQSIRNFGIELSLTLKFLQIIEYIEEY